MTEFRIATLEKNGTVYYVPQERILKLFWNNVFYKDKRTPGYFFYRETAERELERYIQQVKGKL